MRKVIELLVKTYRSTKMPKTLNACQTIAIQTGGQKHRQGFKTTNVGIDVFFRKVP